MISILNLLILFSSVKWMVARNEFLGPRIISGDDAKEDRYPYIVSLRSSLTGRHTCGGTLIAPDVVLTAAHCDGAESIWAGLYRQSDILGTFEDIPIREEIPHPLRKSINAKDHDVMLLILERQSSQPIIKLNNINSIPETNEVLQAIGWGRQDINAERASDILQKVNVTYVGQDVCARGSLYTNDMICTMGFNESGTCRGDSGGPLLILGDDSSNLDVQVGIVSFSSIECVHPLYADYYARVSASFAWIRNMVCAFSVASPMYLNCSKLSSHITHAPSFGYIGSKDSRSPTASLVPTISYVPILLKFKVDAYPYDFKWYILEVGGEQNVVALQRSEGYESGYRTYFEEIKTLYPDTEYKLILLDTCPGGMNGFVTIFLGFEEGDNNVLAFVDLYDVGSFENFEIKFKTSLNKNSTGSLPSETPSESPSILPSQPSISPNPTYISTLIMIRFRTYVDSRTTSWRIESSSGTIIHVEPAGFFRGHEPTFLTSLDVNDGEAYNLVITDETGQGFSGEASVYYGNLLDESTLIAFYDGYLGPLFYEKVIAFTASLDSTINIFPTTSPSHPTISPAPTGPSVSVTVTVLTDMYPLDTGWKISNINDDFVVSQVSVGTFEKRSSLYSKQVYLFSNKKYDLTIMDRVGDGMQGKIRITLESYNSSLLLVSFHQSNETFSEKKISFEIPMSTISSQKPSTSKPYSESFHPSSTIPTRRFNVSASPVFEVTNSLEDIPGSMPSQEPSGNMPSSNVDIKLITYTFLLSTTSIIFLTIL